MVHFDEHSSLYKELTPRSLSFSIVIVTWNSADELAALLTSLAAHLDTDYEIIVVDNSSSDDSVAIAESWQGRRSVIRLNTNVGFGAANNVGVRMAQAPVVVMLNPDTLVLDASISRLVQLAAKTGALCGPELRTQRGARQPSAAPLPGGWETAVVAIAPAAALPRSIRYRCEPWRSPQTLEAGWLNGACIASRRDVLLTLGPFDERLHLYSEDMDLGLRARAAGVPSVFAPDVASVVHLGDRSSGRRFADAGLALSIRNRRRVVRWRRGAARERYDFAGQCVYHVLRYGVKRLLRRDFTRERQWLTAVRMLQH
jgi:N-acetylglucosaminyl-diphospho-decaprenol L-rhamnosyltransferase